MILFATARALRMARIQQVLHAMGLDEQPRVVSPLLLCQTLRADDDGLVFIDGRSSPSWEMMSRARRCAPQARFVLCSRTVTPELVQAAMECGIDGVLSTALPLEDATRTLAQICRGERHLRFEPAQPRIAAPPARHEEVDFDALWMFGAAEA